MSRKSKKCNAEERALEVISRFDFLTDEYYQIKCALELVKENRYIYNGPCQMNTFHSAYWGRVQTVLEKKIEVIEKNG